MKYIHKLCKANLASSTLRRRLVIWSIVLSTILVLGVGSLTISSLVSRDMYYEGRMASYDGYYREVTQRQINEVIKNESVKEYGVINRLKVQVLANQQKIDIQYVNKSYMEKFNYTIKEGHYPKEENEIAFTRSALKELGLSTTIGDHITVNSNNNEKELESKTFILSGIVEDRQYDSKKGKGFISEKYLNKVNNRESVCTIFISVNKTMDKSSSIDEIAEMAGIKYEQVRSKGKIQNSSIVGYIIIAILVIILSIITISNIFSYTLIERVNTIGLLKAVGMTNKQLRQLFKKEGLYYYLKGVSSGIIVGILINIGIMMMYINDASDVFSLSQFIKIYTLIAFKNYYYPILLIVTCLLEMIAVIIAIKIPSRKVKKMSIVGAIHFVDKIKVKKTKRKNLRFKNPSLKLAYVNLNNNRLKTILSVFTMSICIVLFLYLTSFLAYIDNETMVRRGMLGDIDIHSLSMDDMPFIESLQGVDNKYIRVGKIGKIPTSEIKIKETYIEDLKRLQEYKDNNEDADIQLFSYNNNMLERQYKYIHSPYSLDELRSMKDWCLIYDYNDTKNYKAGEILTVDNKNIKIIGKITRVPDGWNDFLAPLLIVDHNFIVDNYKTDELNRNIVGLDISKKNYETVKDQIVSKYKNNENTFVTYFDDELKRQESAKNAASLLGYLFIGTIGIISLFMLVNSMYTSIISRKREFGMLRAIGMTKQQFYKYLYFEGNIIIIFITLIGISGGYLLSKMSYNYFISFSGNEGFIFRFPYWSLLIIVIYHFIIRGIIKVSMRRMDKEAVVDLIRHV